MPESRNRTGHNYQAPADVPSSQRAKGRALWSILLAVFAALVAFFATTTNYLVVAVAAVLGAVLGYIIGKAMEKDMKRREK